MVTINKVLLVGGSDPSGGAGIQADLKTLLELGIYPYTALAAITSQNSSRVSAREPVTARMLREQINLLLEDGPIQGLKTGMLGSSENILEIVRLISEQNIKYSIVDPVIRASDGSMLASEASIAVLRKRLIPACFMVTPNIVEAQILTGVHIKDEDDILRSAKALKETGVKWVLIKGGHFESDMAIDLLYDGKNEYFFETKKIESKNVRGTGCMMASAVCAFLVRGLSPEEAVDKAKAYVFSKIFRAVPLGKGSLQAVHGTLQTMLAGPQQNTAGATQNAADTQSPVVQNPNAAQVSDPGQNYGPKSINNDSANNQNTAGEKPDELDHASENDNEFDTKVEPESGNKPNIMEDKGDRVIQAAIPANDEDDGKDKRAHDTIDVTVPKDSPKNSANDEDDKSQENADDIEEDI